MTGSAIVNDNTTYDVPKNAMLSSKSNTISGIVVIITSLIEAVVAYMFYFNPFYIKPVYRNAAELSAKGNPTEVVFFKDMFISKAEAEASTTIQINLFDKFLEIGIIYLIITVLPIVMAFLHMKRQSFTSSYFVINYFAKIVFAVVPFLIPYSNLIDKAFKKRFLYLKISCAIFLAFAIVGLIYFFTLKMRESIKEKFLSPSDIKALKSRVILGSIMVVPVIAFTLMHKITATFASKTVLSFFMEWKDTAVTQGWVNVIVLTIFLLCILAYISEKDFGIMGIAAFSLGFFFADILSFVTRVKASKFGPNAIILLVQAGISLAIAILALIIIQKLKPKPYEKTRSNTIANISINASAFLYVITIVAPMVAKYFANTKGVWAGFDFAYVGLILGVGLIAALSLIKGYDWAYTYMLFSSIAFMIMSISPVLETLNIRNVKIEEALIDDKVYKGMNELLSVSTTLISCAISLAVILILVINAKKIKDYLYQKRF